MAVVYGLAEGTGSWHSHFLQEFVEQEGDKGRDEEGGSMIGK